MKVGIFILFWVAIFGVAVITWLIAYFYCLSKKRELEKERDKLSRYKDRLLDDNASLHLKMEKAFELEERAPKDCTKGVWCKTCVFCRTFHIHNRFLSDFDTFYVCGKSGVCSHFSPNKNEGKETK